MGHYRGPEKSGANLDNPVSSVNYGNGTETNGERSEEDYTYRDRVYLNRIENITEMLVKIAAQKIKQIAKGDKCSNLTRIEHKPVGQPENHREAEYIRAQTEEE